MGFQEEAADIKSYFDTEWTAAQGSVLWHTDWGTQPSVIGVAYGNSEYKPSGKRPYLRLSVLDGDSYQVGFGAALRRWRTVGAVVVQIFVAVGYGEKHARAMADIVSTIFRGEFVGGDIQFKAPSLIVVGAQPGGAWWQLNVNIPYYRDELI